MSYIRIKYLTEGKSKISRCLETRQENLKNLVYFGSEVTTDIMSAEIKRIILGNKCIETRNNQLESNYSKQDKVNKVYQLSRIEFNSSFTVIRKTTSNCQYYPFLVKKCKFNNNPYLRLQYFTSYNTG